MESLQRELEQLKERVSRLDNTTTIPLEVDQAFRDRLGIGNFAAFEPSIKSASSENQVVNEAGSQIYSVLKPPDGFRQITVGGTTFYIAVWTSV